MALFFKTYSFTVCSCCSSTWQCHQQSESWPHELWLWVVSWYPVISWDIPVSLDIPMSGPGISQDIPLLCWHLRDIPEHSKCRKSIPDFPLDILHWTGIMMDISEYPPYPRLSLKEYPGIIEDIPGVLAWKSRTPHISTYLDSQWLG